MTRTILHTLCTGLALEIAVYRSQPAVAQTANFRALSALLHRFWILDFCDRKAFDLIWRQDTELYGLDTPQGRA